VNQTPIKEPSPIERIPPSTIKTRSESASKLNYQKEHEEFFKQPIYDEETISLLRVYGVNAKDSQVSIIKTLDR